MTDLEGTKEAELIPVQASRAFPWLTLCLVGLLVAWHVYLFGFGGQVSGETLIRFGARKANFGFPQAPWRLLASIFLHGGWWHLVSNALVLFLWGSLIQRVTGRGSVFLVVFCVSGLWGSILSDIYGPDVLAVGASGGAAGLVLFVLILGLLSPQMSGWEGQARPWVSSSVMAVLFNVGMALGLTGNASAGRLDHWAHAGGALLGALLGLAASRDSEDRATYLSLVSCLACIGACLLVWSRGVSPFG